MRLGIKGKQVLGVTSIVVVVVVVLSVLNLARLRASYSSQGQNLEFRGPLLLGNTEIGSTRIGVSTLLVRQDLDQSLRPALLTAIAALAISVIVATLLSQLFLRPIHMIRSG